MIRQHLCQYTTLRHETDMFNQSVSNYIWIAKLKKKKKLFLTAGEAICKISMFFFFSFKCFHPYISCRQSGHLHIRHLDLKDKLNSFILGTPVLHNSDPFLLFQALLNTSWWLCTLDLNIYLFISHYILLSQKNKIWRDSILTLLQLHKHRKPHLLVLRVAHVFLVLQLITLHFLSRRWSR